MKKILLCGVGGQGTILAAHILADAAMRNGQGVKVSEIHGMAQRGGAVSTMIAIGDDVASMVIGHGEADVVIAFDKLEALRMLPTLRSGGLLIVNDELIKPASVLTGKASLPDSMDDALEEAGALIVPAEAAAREAGSPRSANVVLLGAASDMLGIPEDILAEAVKANVPAKSIQENEKAFAAGRQFAKEHEGER